MVEAGEGARKVGAVRRLLAKRGLELPAEAFEAVIGCKPDERPFPADKDTVLAPPL